MEERSFSLWWLAMIQKSIFSASFEESLSILDDNGIKFWKTGLEPEKVRKPRPILVKILVTLGLLLLYGMTLLVTSAVQNGIEDSPVPQPKINFLPSWSFWICLTIWFIVWLIIQIKKYDAVQGILSQFRAWLYVIWLLSYINLMFLTMFLIPMTITGIIFFFLVIILVAVLIVRAKIRSLNKEILRLEMQENKIDSFLKRTIHYSVKYGWSLIAFYMIWKFIFPGTTGVRMDVIGFMGIITMWLIADVAVVAVLAYLVFPLLLLGYYIFKYPEEYRDWEGKTKEEWYGQKYLKKLEKRKLNNE